MGRLPWQVCEGANGLHLSRLLDAAVRSDEVFQARVGLWRMDVGPIPPAGLLLELSAGSEVERCPIGLAQFALRSTRHPATRGVGD
ncbi:hypothetical protein, partial [Micromonospora thermarum]|uniref:hypothetical protein n=1 Tax=Micromonospora thermarum TaxID=2720024 RepID=UPI00197C8407